MIVMTRKVGQALVIGDSIEVVVLEVRGDQTRIEVQLPQYISILRKETWEQLQKEQSEDANQPIDPMDLGS
jgi:carbon storage regulator